MNCGCSQDSGWDIFSLRALRIRVLLKLHELDERFCWVSTSKHVVISHFLPHVLHNHAHKSDKQCVMRCFFKKKKKRPRKVRGSHLFLLAWHVTVTQTSTLCEPLIYTLLLKPRRVKPPLLKPLPVKTHITEGEEEFRPQWGWDIHLNAVQIWKCQHKPESPGLNDCIYCACPLASQKPVIHVSVHVHAWSLLNHSHSVR